MSTNRTLENVRILLPYANATGSGNDTWETNKTKVASKGEPCIYANVTLGTETVTMLKVGDGTTTLENLSWIVCPPSTMDIWPDKVKTELTTFVNAAIESQLADFVTAEELNSAVTTAISTHLDSACHTDTTYTAGTNISISGAGNQINCTLTADGTTTTISGNKISAVDQTSAITDEEIDTIFTEVFGGGSSNS